MSRRRPGPKTIALGAFLLLLAVTPFVPRGGGDGALRPSGEGEGEALAATAGRGRLTPALRAEVDKVVGAGLAAGRLSGKVTPDRLVSTLVRCADFEGQRYCLGSGWTEDTQSEVQARMTTAARAVAARPAPTESTGDLDVLATLQRTATLSPEERAARERAELVMAARSVAKVWLIRHDIEGVPLPDGFLDRHPEAVATSGAGAEVPAPARASNRQPPASRARPTVRIRTLESKAPSDPAQSRAPQ